MHIGSFTPAAGVAYAASSSRSSPVAAAAASYGKVTDGADSVTISAAARQAASAERAGALAASGEAGAAGDYPVEMYQLPKWYADYGFQLPTQPGSRGDWFAESYPQAAAASSAERAEYSTLIQEHYQAVLAENGVKGVAAHYAATILDQDSSEALRRQMVERIRGDDRLLELMPKMGKPIP
ncbi:MAG: hypothetical protein BGO63_16295 [Candidatus Accumulibacter sp. 66-26]|nr:hypothetical protein [Accumulibacter sp.]OJW50739.1 MAG: hypothetical protein BGO63_16295 [Candidatus Accumulibacter sp. 66-26]